jgi:Icc-related predicted phosphoesterase
LDLHQDHIGNSWDPAAHLPAGGFDIAVVAGDVHSPLTSAIDWLADRFPGVRVLYVPGNHDFWWDGGDRYTHDSMLARGRDLAARRGIDLLSNDTVVINGARFVGATLWTDMRLGSFSAAHAYGSARRHMNDFRMIRRRPSGRHRHIRVADTVDMHRLSRSYIDGVLAMPHAGPSVVVSHHAPHALSLPDPHFDLRWAYASDLGGLIAARQPDLWVHGHLHSRLDYRVGQTRIVANARGHEHESGRAQFDPSLVISIAPSSAQAGVS